MFLWTNFFHSQINFFLKKIHAAGDPDSGLSLVKKLISENSRHLSPHIYSLALKMCVKYELDDEVKALAQHARGGAHLNSFLERQLVALGQ